MQKPRKNFFNRRPKYQGPRINDRIRSLDVQVLDAQGKRVYPLMGCYGIGVTRIVAAAI